MGKAIRIDNETYNILDKMKEKFGKTYGALVGVMIQYFEKKGIDPYVLLEEEDGLLLQIKQQNDSILDQLNKLRLPVMSELPKEEEMRVNGINFFENSKIKDEKPISLTSLYHPGILCPQCGANWDSFTNQGTNLICQNCELSFPMFFGDELLELLDVFCLLSGGITRQITYAKDGTERTVRLFLDKRKGLIELPTSPVRHD